MKYVIASHLWLLRFFLLSFPHSNQHTRNNNNKKTCKNSHSNSIEAISGCIFGGRHSHSAFRLTLIWHFLANTINAFQNSTILHTAWTLNVRAKGLFSSSILDKTRPPREWSQSMKSQAEKRFKLLQTSNDQEQNVWLYSVLGSRFLAHFAIFYHSSLLIVLHFTGNHHRHLHLHLHSMSLPHSLEWIF